jgi:4-hydroxybenzoate polyprenyltransferase
VGREAPAVGAAREADDASLEAGARGGLRDYVRLLRPHQWTKNLLVFAGPIFARRTDPANLLRALEAFALFCVVSSGAYVLNDVLDRDRDRSHPKKRLRPVASGRVPVPAAVALAVLLLAGGLVAGLLVARRVELCLALYAANALAYSRVLKHSAIVDVMSIAFGFVVRLVAGVFAVDALPTAWIVLCTFFLATFLGFAKRRAELAALGGGERGQRPVLRKYTVPYLDALLAQSAVMAIMSFALFTVTSGKNPTLLVTLPIVFYAVMHYKRLVLVLDGGEEPDRVLLRDWRLWLCVAAWLALYLWVDLADVRLFV